MSAYIVEPETINKVVTFLNAQSRDFSHVMHKSDYDLTNFDDLQRLAEDLYLMNCDAVDGRYGKGTAANDEANKPTHTFRFTPGGVEDIAAYKSAQCLLYQCSEADIPDRPLYQLLYNLVHAIAHHIIRQTPEYNTAKWG
jgi:hypothetical protein